MKRSQGLNIYRLALLIMLLASSMISFALESSVFVEPLELKWRDLIPEELKNKSPALIDHNQEASQVAMNPSLEMIKQELNGTYVKIAGFIVPLDGNEGKVTAFLLVPYFGTCIHVPPPPPNQIIYVEFSEGVDSDIIYDAVWVEGVLEAGIFENRMASTGYKINPIKVTPYEYE